ncbi:MAG: glycoside hydrolase family 3 C-terminal domain-containing protein [Bacilli bacterium]|nr:glycoside hydrolase family 3 C-terminal domain-containing protein [Bacilli bacterium]
MSTNKEAKKAWKKELNKARKPYKALAITSGVLCALSIGASELFGLVPNAFNILAGSSTSKIKNYDKNAMYFTPDDDLADKEKRIEHENKLVEQIEAEGATLLMNNGNALPLKGEHKISCFSTSSVNLVYGGTGSGAVDSSKAPTLKEALESVGFKVNQTLWDFYKTGAAKKYKRSNGSMVTGESSSTSEAPWSIYSSDVIDSVSEYPDAVVVISRVGGEGADLTSAPTNYLALDENEKSMFEGIKKLKDEGKVNTITVLLNSSNAIQLDFLKADYGIDACMWIGGVGATGINSVAKIISGDINPSGRLVDTFLYDNYSSPAMENFRTQVYGEAEKYKLNNWQKNYVVYQEGIYVGYRYYETRYYDCVNGKGNTAGYKYNDEVAYPFGYGQSYTDFSYENFQILPDGDDYKVKLTVNNVGDVAGKETVQIYASKPYTDYDKANYIEKAAVELVGFTKTSEIAAHSSETVEISVKKDSFKSYDAYNAKGYILDAGDYYLTAARDSHQATNNILAIKEGKSVADGMDSNGSSSLAGKALTVSALDTETFKKSENGTTITNQFDNGDLNLYMGENTIKYLSRSDWKETYPARVELSINEKLLKDLAMQRHENIKSDKSELPTMGAKNGLKAYDFIGKDLDDAEYEKLLDQLTLSEMINFTADAFHLTRGISSIQLPQTRQENGPQGYTGFFGIGGGDPMAITSCDILAATYNVDIAKEVGRCIGNDCLLDGISALYGPGNNTHRTPYSGRNFEYYSEDPYISSIIALYEDKAIMDKGVSVEMKHFVVNDCEENRSGLGTWLNEQSMREIYLKPFETIVEADDRAGVMNSYSRIGAIWCGAHEGLLTNVLRGEWGSTGFIITDNATFGYMNGVDGILAGSSLFDSMTVIVKPHMQHAEKDAEFVNALRDACHYNIYNIVNSAGMNGIGPKTTVKAAAPAIQVIPKVLYVIFGVAFIGTLTMSVLKSRKYRSENPKNF